MSLENYGLLTGILVAHGEQHGGNPHHLLTIQAGGMHYRVAVNVRSTPGADRPPELQYQVIPNLRKGRAKARALAERIRNQNRFILAQGDATLRLDYVRDGFLDMSAFQTIPRATDLRNNEFYTTFVAAAAKALESADAWVAVFGNGHGAATSAVPARSSFGFTGIDSVHMNQGTLYEAGRRRDPHHLENGPAQDGGILFFFPDRIVQGFFLKFQSQDNQTDAAGQPVHTSVPELDAVPARVAKILLSGIEKRKKAAAAMLAAMAAAPAPSRRRHPRPPVAGPVTPPPGGFVFSDPPGSPDPLHPFQGDDDSNVDRNFVNQFAVNGVPEPVPAPRGGQYPSMTLESVIGMGAVTAIRNAGQIVIHMAGDTGAPTAVKLPNEMTVAELMLKDFQGDPGGQPAFYFHLGDVVYYFGEQPYYYDQFLPPLPRLPAAHFRYSRQSRRHYLLNADAISGAVHERLRGQRAEPLDRRRGHFPYKHDAARRLFHPGRPVCFDHRTIQQLLGNLRLPGSAADAFSLQRTSAPEAPAGERKDRRRAAGRAPSSHVLQRCEAVVANVTGRHRHGLHPGVVLAGRGFSGHAHVYQRMTRTVNAAGTTRDIPHLVCGAGGYNINKGQEVDKADMQLQDISDPQFRLHRFLANYGYMKLIVTPKTRKNGTLRIEFYSPSLNSGAAADACVLDLETHSLL